MQKQSGRFFRLPLMERRSRNYISEAAPRIGSSYGKYRVSDISGGGALHCDQHTLRAAPPLKGEAMARRWWQAKAFPLGGRWHGIAVTDEGPEMPGIKWYPLHLTTAFGGASPQGEAYARRRFPKAFPMGGGGGVSRRMRGRLSRKCVVPSPPHHRLRRSLPSRGSLCPPKVPESLPLQRIGLCAIRMGKARFIIQIVYFI